MKTQMKRVKGSTVRENLLKEEELVSINKKVNQSKAWFKMIDKTDRAWLLQNHRRLEIGWESYEQIWGEEFLWVKVYQTAWGPNPISQER